MEPAYLAFELRDVSAYLGIESLERRRGKTTLLTVLSQLVTDRSLPPTSVT